MKIICLVKFVPSPEAMEFDKENSQNSREGRSLQINPDDISALYYALKIKEGDPKVCVEVVTMAPKSALNKFKDLLRRDVNSGVFISDSLYSGSDTYATAKIIGRMLKQRQGDWIFTGTHAIDGDTSHIPAQIGEILGYPQMSNIISLNKEGLKKGISDLWCRREGEEVRMEIKGPAVLSFERQKGHKLPYIRYEDFHRDVTKDLEIVSNLALGFEKEEVGQEGSLTEVVKTYEKELHKKNSKILKVDKEGIEALYQYLKEREYLS